MGNGDHKRWVYHSNVFQAHSAWPSFPGRVLRLLPMVSATAGEETASSVQTVTTISVIALNWCQLHVEVRLRRYYSVYTSQHLDASYCTAVFPLLTLGNHTVASQFGRVQSQASNNHTTPTPTNTLSINTSRTLQFSRWDLNQWHSDVGAVRTGQHLLEAANGQKLS